MRNGAINMGYRESVAAADQVASGSLQIEGGPVVAIPRDSALARDPLAPIVVVRLIGSDYYLNPRGPANLLVVVPSGRVYMYLASQEEQSQLRVTSGVVFEKNVAIRGVRPPLFRIAAQESGAPGLVLKYETTVRTALFTEQLLTEDEIVGATPNLSPATIYFRSTMSPQSALIVQPVLRKLLPPPPAPVFQLPVDASNHEKRINKVRLACIEQMRGKKMALSSGRMLSIPISGSFCDSPPKEAHPCILIMMMNDDFTMRVTDADTDVFYVFVISGESVNLATMDDDTWDAWAKHRDSTADYTIIYHRMGDVVAGVRHLGLVAGPDPAGRTIVEMRLAVRAAADAAELPLLQAAGRRAARPGLPAEDAQLFFPVVISLDRSRTNDIYRAKSGGSRANNLFVFEDAVVPVWGQTRWSSIDILSEMLPALPAPQIGSVSAFVEWIRRMWQRIQPPIGPFLAEVAVAYISPSNAYMLVGHAGQRVSVSALLFYTLWDTPSVYVRLGDALVHPFWAKNARRVADNQLDFDDPVGSIAVRGDGLTVVQRGGAATARPAANKGALSDVKEWHDRVLDAFLQSSINNFSLLSDLAMGVESDQHVWTLISDEGERVPVSGVVFQLVFVQAHAALNPFISVGGMFFRHDWWMFAVEHAAASILFVDPVGEVKLRAIRPLAPNKRLRGETRMNK